MEHLTLIERPNRLQTAGMILVTLLVFGLVDYFFALHSVFGPSTPGSVLKVSKAVVAAEVTLRYEGKNQRLADLPTVPGLRKLRELEIGSYQERFELESAGLLDVVQPRIQYIYEVEQPISGLDLLHLRNRLEQQGVGLRKLLVSGLGHYHFLVGLKPFCVDPRHSGKCATLDVWLERRAGSRVRKLQNSGYLNWVDSFVFNSKAGRIQAFARYNAASDVLELLQILQLEGLHPNSVGVVVSEFAEQ